MSRFNSNKMFDLKDLKANGFTFGGTGLTCMCLYIAWWFSGELGLGVGVGLGLGLGSWGSRLRTTTQCTGTCT